MLVHAENGDVIDLLIAEALAAGHTTPEWHARTRPAWGAVEASLRGSALAAQTRAPLYIVHMNVAGEVDHLLQAKSPYRLKTHLVLLAAAGGPCSRHRKGGWACCQALPQRHRAVRQAANKG